MSPESHEAIANGEIAKDSIPEFYLDVSVSDNKPEVNKCDISANTAGVDCKLEDVVVPSNTLCDVGDKHITKNKKEKKEKKEKKHKKHTKSSKKHSKSRSK